VFCILLTTSRQLVQRCGGCRCCGACVIPHGRAGAFESQWPVAHFALHRSPILNDIETTKFRMKSLFSFSDSAFRPAAAHAPRAHTHTTKARDSLYERRDPPFSPQAVPPDMAVAATRSFWEQRRVQGHPAPARRRARSAAAAQASKSRVQSAESAAQPRWHRQRRRPSPPPPHPVPQQTAEHGTHTGRREQSRLPWASGRN
jgi:hypothetical protein